MTTSTFTKTTTLALLSLTGVLALGAAQAYAAENVLVQDDGQSRAWAYTKTAVTPDAAIAVNAPVVTRKVEELPDLVVPLNTDIKVRAAEARDLSAVGRYSTDLDLREFNLLEDETMFIGAQGRSEFDTLDAQKGRAAYPDTLNVDPLVPVAGAGLATSF